MTRAPIAQKKTATKLETSPSARKKAPNCAGVNEQRRCSDQSGCPSLAATPSASRSVIRQAGDCWGPHAAGKVTGFIDRTGATARPGFNRSAHQICGFLMAVKDSEF